VRGSNATRAVTVEFSIGLPVKESLPTVFYGCNGQRDRPSLRGSCGASAANDSKRGEGARSHSVI
jgi:hypothetical protein